MIPSANQPAKPAKSPFLGIDAKSLHAAGGPVSGEPSENRELENIRRRYRLQRVASGLLFNPAAVPIYDQEYGVCKCHRSRLSDRVQLHRNVDGSGARFSGLDTCGSVWHCPVCAHGITNKRKAELVAGLVAARALGYEAHLLTLTHPHTAELGAADQLAKQADARQRYKNCRAYKRIMAKYGRLGSICSLETTHGKNGWHPHTHEIIFLRPGLLLNAADVDELRREWVRILIKVGLGSVSDEADMLAHAFDLRDGTYAAEYIAKFGQDPQGWQVADELTKSHSKMGGRKIGGGDHVTPFQLLAQYADGNAKAGALFIEYAKAFQGKRMLTWSPGLKAKLGIGEQSDAELVADDAAPDPRPAEEACGLLEADDWRLVLERDARGELLYITARNGWPGVQAFLHELRHHRPKTHRGDSECWVRKPWRPGPG